MEAFLDRSEAGRRLAENLKKYARRPEVMILALPRGGVPVGYELSHALGAPLDVFLVRKLGVPGHEELAMGAIASGGIRVLNREVIDSLGIPPQSIDRVAVREQAELERREREYRGGRRLPELRGRTTILCDDGLATGSSMRAAVAALRRQDAGRIVVAVPVAAARTCNLVRREVDEMVCLMTPPYFQAVGEWYKNFRQVGDDEVRALLARAENEYASHAC